MCRGELDRGELFFVHRPLFPLAFAFVFSFAFLAFIASDYVFHS